MFSKYDSTFVHSVTLYVLRVHSAVSGQICFLAACHVNSLNQFSIVSFILLNLGHFSQLFIWV